MTRTPRMWRCMPPSFFAADASLSCSHIFVLLRQRGDATLLSARGRGLTLPVVGHFPLGSALLCHDLLIAFGLRSSQP
jgi:hypothetical protein